MTRGVLEENSDRLEKLWSFWNDMIYKKLIACAFFSIASFSASSQDVLGYVHDSRLFFDKVSEMASVKVMPRLTNPDTAALILRLSDSGRVFDRVNFDKNSLKILSEVCGVAVKVAGAYALFDLQSQIDPKAPPAAISAKLAEVMQQNIYHFQDELSLLQPFVIKCLAKQVAPTVNFMKGLRPEDLTDVRIGGLRQMKAGIANAYIGMLQATLDQSLGDPYKLALLKALSENAETFQAIMPLQVRKQIIDFLRAMPQDASKRVEPFLKNIESEMSKTSCVDICAIN